MQVQIKFTASGCSSVTGNFAPGDLLRCDEAHARHLVDEVGCAVYEGAAPAPKAQPAEQPAKPRAARKTAKDQA